MGFSTTAPTAPRAGALRDRGFWWLTVAFGTSIMVTVANTVSIIPSLITQGQSPIFAAQVAALFGLMTLAGRLLIGPPGDRMPRHLVTAGLIVMQMAGLSVLALAPTIAGALSNVLGGYAGALWVFVVLLGVGLVAMLLAGEGGLKESLAPRD